MEIKIAKTKMFPSERMYRSGQPTMLNRNLHLLRSVRVGFTEDFSAALADPAHPLSGFFSEFDLGARSGSWASSPESVRDFLVSWAGRFYQYSQAKGPWHMTVIELASPVRGRYLALDIMKRAEAVELISEILSPFRIEEFSPEITLAQDLADSILDPQLRFEARALVLDELFDLGRGEEALSFASRSEDSAAQAYALLGLADGLILDGRRKQAKQLVTEAQLQTAQVQSPAVKAELHTHLTETLQILDLPEAAREEEAAALESARELLSRPYDRAERMIELARVQEYEDSLPTLLEAMRSTADLEIPQIKRTVISQALKVMVEAGEHETALAQARAAHDSELVDLVENTVVKDLIRKGELEQALLISKKKTAPLSRAECFLALSGALEASPFAEEVLIETEEAVLKIDNLLMNNISLIEIARRYLAYDRPDQVRRILDQVLMTASALEPSIDKCVLLYYSAEILHDIQDEETVRPALREALQSLPALSSDEHLLVGELMIKIAKLLYRLGEGDQAGEIFEKIAAAPLDSRLITMSSLGKALHEIGLREEALDIFGRIKGLLPVLPQSVEIDDQLVKVVMDLVDLFPRPTSTPS